MARLDPPAESLPRLFALRRWVVRSFTGRVLIVAGAIKFLTLIISLLLGPPSGVWSLLDTAANLGILLSAAESAFRAIGVLTRRLLWRVRPGDLEPEALRDNILREIQSFVGGAPQHDDMTMLLLKVTGEGRE
jgi:hypothetical protein